jgi:lipid II:glycine glycyltransferase (peptidoglycan interpeptide bridge formation enzyme)
MNYLATVEWDQFLAKFSDSHLLQTSEWGEFKSDYGWMPARVVLGGSGAQILFRNLPLGYTIGYVPKGPLGLINHDLIQLIDQVCVQNNAIVAYIEPDAWEGTFDPASLLALGYQQSSISIQPRQTITISLEGSEEEWLGRMKQKTRYNIRLAEKKDIVIRQSSDIEIFNQLMKATGERNAFGIHQEDYYRNVHERFSQLDMCRLLVAYYQDNPLAALLMFHRGRRAWYFYGASGNLERNRMPAYLLQFEAMRIAKELGCAVYDLWGIPDFPESYLEEKFTTKNDGLWSVYRFKRGFGGVVKRSAGVFQKVFKSTPYRFMEMVYQLRKRELA